MISNSSTINDHVKFAVAFRHATNVIPRDGLTINRAYMLVSIYYFRNGDPFKMIQLLTIYPKKTSIFYYTYLFVKHGFLIKDHFIYSFSEKAIKYINDVMQITNEMYSGDYYFYIKKS
jgi:hypothetical protein